MILLFGDFMEGTGNRLEQGCMALRLLWQANGDPVSPGAEALQKSPGPAEGYQPFSILRPFFHQPFSGTDYQLLSIV